MKNHSSSRSSATLPVLGLTLALLATASGAAEQGADSDWKQAEAPPQLVAVPESTPVTPQAAAVTPPAAAPQEAAAAAAPVSAPTPVSTAATDARSVTEVRAPSPEVPTGQAAVAASAPVQETAANTAPEEEALEPELAPLQVGDATRNLMGWQSNGSIASATPRPIAGDVAQRSYARYLKSFEFAIPERFSSTVKSTSGGSSGQ